MARKFASQGDMTETKITFDEIGAGLYAFTAEGDPNSGVIIGDDSVMVVEAQATPRLARKVIEALRNSARRLPPLWACRAALRIVLTDPERTSERRLLALLTLGLVVALLAPRTGVP